jgi:hypothetical protein
MWRLWAAFSFENCLNSQSEEGYTQLVACCRLLIIIVLFILHISRINSSAIAYEWLLCALVIEIGKSKTPIILILIKLQKCCGCIKLSSRVIIDTSVKQQQNRCAFNLCLSIMLDSLSCSFTSI